MEYGAPGKIFYRSVTVNGIDGSAVDADSLTLNLRKRGDPAGNAPVVPDSAPTITKLTNAAFGSGKYEIAIDSTGLPDGAEYGGYLDISLDNGSVLPAIPIEPFGLYPQYTKPDSLGTQAKQDITDILTTFDVATAADVAAVDASITQADIDAIRDAIKNRVIDPDGGITDDQAMQAIYAYVAGNTQNSGLVFLSADGKVIRLTGSIDPNTGDRSVVPNFTAT